MFVNAASETERQWSTRFPSFRRFFSGKNIADILFLYRVIDTIQRGTLSYISLLRLLHLQADWCINLT